MRKRKQRKSMGGNAHDRAVAKTGMEKQSQSSPAPKYSSDTQLHPVQDDSAKHWSLGDTFTIMSFGAAMICWAMIPNVTAKTVAVIVGCLILGRAAYRGHFARNWPSFWKHTAAILGSVLILGWAAVRLWPEWKLKLEEYRQEHSKIASNAVTKAVDNGPQKDHLSEATFAGKKITKVNRPVWWDQASSVAIPILKKYISRQDHCPSYREAQDAVNKELALQHSPYRIKFPPKGTPHCGVSGIDDTMSDIWLTNAGPNKDATGISMGDRSKFTMNRGGIAGFGTAIKTGDDSTIKLNDAQIMKTVPAVQNNLTCAPGSICNQDSPNNGVQTVINTDSIGQITARQDGNHILVSAIGGRVEPVSIGLVFDADVALESKGVTCMSCGDGRMNDPAGQPDGKTIWVFWKSPALLPEEPVTITFRSSVPAKLLRVVKLKMPLK